MLNFMDANELKKPSLITRMLAILGGNSIKKKRGKIIAEAERIRSIYERFREILSLNDSTLQLIADIEDRLSGRSPFSLDAINRRVQQAEMDVFAMVKNLDRLAPGRYAELYTCLRKISANIESEMAKHQTIIQGPLTIPLSKLYASSAVLAGIKMANLGEIHNVLGLEVPEGFVVTTAAFGKFMAQDEILEQAGKLEEVAELYGPRVGEEACRRVQQAIIDGLIPSELKEAVLDSFDGMSGGSDILVAVRSSAAGEDKIVSHAGQFQTELNVGKNWLLDSYRWVLASSYAIGPVMYRLKHGLTSRDAFMAVGCLKMVDPRFSGIMFSRSFENPHDDIIVISVTPGISDAGSGKAERVEEIITSSAGETKSQSTLLNKKALDLLISAARRLEKHFGSPQDIEWAIDKSDKLYILQSRSMSFPAAVPDSAEPIITLDKKPILRGGISACPGYGAGPVFIVGNDDDLALFPENGVLVSRHSSPKYSVVMSRCAAIVTERGSPIGHMSILSREYGVPTIVGLSGALNTLANGQQVTVNATLPSVYDNILMRAPGRIATGTIESDSPAVAQLKKIAGVVTPLNLIDTTSSAFMPSNCQSLHDITRFVHEKVFEIMFFLGNKASVSSQNAIILDGNLPYIVYVLDVGGGLAEKRGQPDRVFPPEIVSAPMKSFIMGLMDPQIKWDKPRAVSTRGFLSVLGESVAGLPAEVQGVGRASFAIISDRYMNFSTKAGYHFNTVDTYCGKNLNKNYIHFRFEGGAAAEIRRARRCRFLEKVLTALEFKVQHRGDVIVARIEKYDCDFIGQHLVDLGRLTLCSRQLDMLMDSDDSPDFFAQAFLAGKFDQF